MNSWSDATLARQLLSFFFFVDRPLCDSFLASPAAVIGVSKSTPLPTHGTHREVPKGAARNGGAIPAAGVVGSLSVFAAPVLATRQRLGNAQPRGGADATSARTFSTRHGWGIDCIQRLLRLRLSLVMRLKLPPQPVGLWKETRPPLPCRRDRKDGRCFHSIGHQGPTSQLGVRNV